ncbi:hypothetical protein DFH28DRAFT_632370 [Melampsora americana]|nr:hypothetical protein DFH28DRAFT_632370 [Melampsora americana]
MFVWSTIRQVGTHAYSTASSKPITNTSSGSLKWIAMGGVGLGAGYWMFKSKGISPLEAKQLEDKAKNTLANITSGSGSASQAALSPEEWRDFKLQKVIPYNHNTSTFVFELPKNVPSGLTIASALITKSVAKDGILACTDDKGKLVIRPYTPTTPPDQHDTLHCLYISSNLQVYWAEPIEANLKDVFINTNDTIIFCVGCYV